MPAREKASYPASSRIASLKRDEIGMDHHRALGCCLSMIFSENRCTLFRIMLQPPAWHFFMKEVFAAPASFLPSALTALVAQASVVHFFMNDVLAAPDSALPSLPTAL